MSRAIDAQKKRNANQQKSSSSRHMALQRMAWGLWGAPAAGRTPASMRSVRWIQVPARKRCQQPMRCVFAFSVSQHHAKEILDDPPLKVFIDRARKRYGKALINYPQPCRNRQRCRSRSSSRTTPTGRRSSPRKGRVAREEAFKLDALQQPTHTARHRQRSNSSWMRGWSGSRKCAASLESQPPSRSREVQIRVSHVKCKSE
jgi:hypothetical protein